MANRTWYLDASGAKVNLNTAVVNGAATTTIYRATERYDTVELVTALWRRAGAKVSASDLARAVAEQSTDAAPAVPAARKARGRILTTEDIQSVKTGTVVGAVTVDTSAAAVHVLTLTGNVTSFTLTGLAGAPGKAVEVHLVQDGTGSRTLAGVAASVKLAGGALNLSTGAGKRDVLRFRVLGSVAYETGRALNV